MEAGELVSARWVEVLPLEDDQDFHLATYPGEAVRRRLLLPEVASMNVAFLRRLSLCCLTSGLVLAACEPITVVLPGGQVVVNPPPLEPEQPQEDGGVDGGAGDPGSGDGGTETGRQGWSVCLMGWQHRVVVPLGNKSGDAYFALAANGDAYVTQYPDAGLGVLSVESGPLPPPDLGWAGIPWVGGLEVDDWDILHLGVSSADGGTLDSQSIEYLTYVEGRWRRTQVGEGQIVDFGLSPDGSAHVLSVRGESQYRFEYATNRSGPFVSESTGISLGSLPVQGRMRLDTRGLPHFVYEGRLTGTRGIFHVTKDGGTWSREQVSTEGTRPAIGLDREGVPHVVWTFGGELWHGVRDQGTWNLTHVASDVAGGVDLQVDASGGLHVLATDVKSASVLYLHGRQGGWTKTAIASALEVRGELIGAVMRLRLDPSGRVHAMYALLFPNATTGRIDRLIEYSRQCP